MDIAGYLILCARRRAPIGWRDISLPVPHLRTAVTQIALSSTDILLAAGALYVLLPRGIELSFPLLLGIYLVALTASVLTHVPGGVGVLEAMVLWSLPDAPRAPVLASLMAFRIAYYLVPLAIALVFLARPAGLQLGHRALSWAGAFRPLVPLLAAVFSWLSGVFLLVSGAAPRLDSGVAAIRGVVPLPLLELSHLGGSIAGLGLVVLGGALYRRYDTARIVAILLLLVGAGAVVLHGQGETAALVLGGAAAALAASASAFHRKGSLWRNAVSAGWIAAGLLALCLSVWLGLRWYADVPYSDDLWWRFAYDSDAPRFLRASLVVGILGVALLVARLLGPARERRRPDPVSPAVLAAVAACPDTQANLALLGDKRFLLSRSGRSCLMYQVEGRSRIAMGDPIGPLAEWPELIWRFRETADLAGVRPVFYETLGDHLHLYADAGLSAHKIGEEALVDLATFNLGAPAAKPFRAALRRGERAGLSFEILPAADVSAILGEIEEVSRDWLGTKQTPEKGFSMGAFDPAYLARCDCAVVRKDGRIVGFANLWFGADLHEASLDLMRHRSAAPYGTMMFLIVNLMLAAQRTGYRWFNLGMAPLAGLERHRLAPKWHAIGRIIFSHGERLYGFSGLRRYKAQFHPIWRPRYVICMPGAIALALGLADCMRLISRPLARAARAPSQVCQVRSHAVPHSIDVLSTRPVAAEEAAFGSLRAGPPELHHSHRREADLTHAAA